MKHKFREAGFLPLSQDKFGLDLHLHCSEERRLKMSTIVIVLVVVFLPGGGGWGYSRWRN